MAELHEYSQYQCDRCGFRTRSPDEDEVVEIAIEHAERMHEGTLDRDEVRGELRTLELEGYPENA
jgi:predicted small metal-binding protein